MPDNLATSPSDQPSLIHTLEALAANAWPAAKVTPLDGWRLRYTHGVTRRANSVWPNQDDGTISLADRLAQVEAFYAAHQLPARYQICPATCPSELDAQLADRGYNSVARTAVQITPLTKILEQTQALRWFPTFDVEISEEFDEDWFAIYRQIEHGDEASLTARRGILQRIAAPVAFARLTISGEPAAAGLGVLEQGWLGIFCMGTLPAFRRQGAANVILRTLAIWAQLYDAKDAYLQVMAENAPAQALYGRAGFTTLYHYHYREKTVTSSQ